MKIAWIVCTGLALILAFNLGMSFNSSIKEQTDTPVTKPKVMALKILKHNLAGVIEVKITELHPGQQQGVLVYTLENGLKGMAYLQKGESFFVEN